MGSFRVRPGCRHQSGGACEQVTSNGKKGKGMGTSINPDGLLRPAAAAAADAADATDAADADVGSVMADGET